MVTWQEELAALPELARQYASKDPFVVSLRRSHFVVQVDVLVFPRMPHSRAALWRHIVTMAQQDPVRSTEIRASLDYEESALPGVFHAG